MSVLPPEETRSMLAGNAGRDDLCGVLAQRWVQLHDQARELSSFADLAPRSFGENSGDFPAMLERAGQWQCNLAWQAIDDIDAMMQPGMTALRLIAARGKDATAPALALWREFHAAREAVLEMLQRTPAGEALDPA